VSRRFKVVIPARYGSSRLPGKPLADVGGRPMVVRVLERALQAGAEQVVVATDDQRIVAAVTNAGGIALPTRADHPSGSDRVMEVAAALDWPADAVVVNVQGDEPLIPPAVIAQVAAMLLDDPATGVATLCEPITDPAVLFDPSAVKVVRNRDGFALYFSRAPLPYARDAFAEPGAEQRPLPVSDVWQRHIGIYGFRVRTLARFVGLAPGVLERLESLEQLRLLEHGIPIRVAPANAHVPAGVDTDADLARVRRILLSGE
jgi:3-deoxy-manno-octulosonate cytidylyltransferase (CMP-KDO synthetase)